MDNDMLGKIGRGFCNDGIFGVVKAAFGIDEPPSTPPCGKEAPNTRRLFIGSSPRSIFCII